MFSDPIEGITMPNGDKGDVTLIVGNNEWYPFAANHLERLETVHRIDLMPAERKAIGDLRKGSRLRWPLTRLRLNNNIWLYLGDDPTLESFLRSL